MELGSLTVDDLEAILRSAKPACHPVPALLATEGVTLELTPMRCAAWRRSPATSTSAPRTSARAAVTVMERLLDEVSFDAPTAAAADRHAGRGDVDARLSELAHNEDLSRYIL